MYTLALALVIVATADASMEERMRALEQRVEEKISAIEAQVLPEGALLTFADGRTKCPVGYVEPAHLKGRMMTTIPINGTSGVVFNRPFDAGEIGRTPAHSHAVSVNDPGHTHVGIVNDPGHAHGWPGAWSNRIQGWPAHSMLQSASFADTTTNKTGITIDNLPAKSAIEVSIDANDAGEHYPLVYVLICQKLP
jgi:hypothetical protein